MNRSPRKLFYILIFALCNAWAQSPEQTKSLMPEENLIVNSDASKNIGLNKIEQNDSTSTSIQEPWLTVFVHGIKSVKPHISLDNFFRFMVDDIENTVYAKTIELMRKDPFFYKNQPMREIGLHRADPNDIGRRQSSKCPGALI